MNILKIFSIVCFLFALSVWANNLDDEIISNLDFYQSLDFLKEENPFLTENTQSKENAQGPSAALDPEKNNEAK
ncbi:MAG: hypothetical protein Q7U04_05800 [Bacteriovorax sp.]|nr:hypothetical protein [Bacteriovorax sp.]